MPLPTSCKFQHPDQQSSNFQLYMVVWDNNRKKDSYSGQWVWNRGNLSHFAQIHRLLEWRHVPKTRNRWDPHVRIYGTTETVHTKESSCPEERNPRTFKMYLWHEICTRSVDCISVSFLVCYIALTVLSIKQGGIVGGHTQRRACWLYVWLSCHCVAL